MPDDTGLLTSATVILLRDGGAGPEVFMVRRHEATSFMGGAHVFPGGVLDASDRDEAGASWCDGLDHAAQQLPALVPAEAVAFHVAAVRELFEEAGVLLARTSSGSFVPLSDPESHSCFAQYRRELHGRQLTFRDIANRENLRIALDALTLFAHWVTPSVDKRRFDTRFFVTRVPPGQTPAHDRTETSEGVWLRPAAAMTAAMESVEASIVLPPPTWVTLRELEAFGSVDAAIEWAARRDVRRRQPHVIQDGGARTIVMPEDVTPRVRFVFAEGRWQPA